MLDPLLGRVNDWLGSIFQSAPEPPPAPWSEPLPAGEEAPVFEAPLVVEPQPVPEVQRAAPPEFTLPRAPSAAPEVLVPQARATRRIDSLPRVVILPPGAALQEPPSQQQQPVPWQAPEVMATPVPERAEARPPTFGEIVREPDAPPAQEDGDAQ
jgi:hypothetical protein